MEQTRYLISDAAKQVEVESHVLRYWEEELGIPIISELDFLNMLGGNENADQGTE